jgi:hypothetical protein
MGYLNKATITVDAILTNRGRQILAEQGRNGLQITKFALADDEIDYGLYNLNHPDGEFGSIIENMPLLEATPDEQQIMRYKLVSLDDSTFGTVFNPSSGVIIIPRITNINSSYTLSQTGTNQVRLSPATTPTRAAGTTTGFASETYTYLIGNARLFDVYKGTGATISPANLLNGTVNANGSLTLSAGDPTATTGVVFNGNEGITLVWKSGYAGKSTQLTVFGDSTGATASTIINIATTSNGA